MNELRECPKTTAQTRDVRDYSRVLAHPSSALSNEPIAVGLLRESSDHLDWVGIYLVHRNDLVLKIYGVNEEAEHVRIPIGREYVALLLRKGRSDDRGARC